MNVNDIGNFLINEINIFVMSSRVWNKKNIDQR